MAEKTRRRRGRPRPAETLDRDARVLELLEDGTLRTRDQIAEELGESSSLTYLSLNRLRGHSLVRRCLDGSIPVWTAETGEPCP